MALFINLALAVTVTFIALFAPFLTSLSSFLQAIHRIFPFARGLFEDKVANAWCALNVVIKLRDLAPVSTLAKLALLATVLAVLPSVAGVVAVSWQLGRSRAPSASTIPPTIVLLPHALFLSAMSFFLFSFQVHEKSILLPLMPLTLLMGGREVGYGRLDWEWGVLVNNVAVFSMWPLLKRDGLAVQYLALTGLWNWAVGYNPLAMRASFVKFLSLVCRCTLLYSSRSGTNLAGSRRSPTPSCSSSTPSNRSPRLLRTSPTSSRSSISPCQRVSWDSRGCGRRSG